MLQVSCHRCNKAIKNACKSVKSFSVRENWALYELVMAKNKSDGLHNKGWYHKEKYNATFFCIKGFAIQKKCMATSASLCKGPILYSCAFTFMQESKFFSLFLFIFLFWQASYGEERSRHIYLVGYEWAWVIIVGITPKVNTLGGETISPYLSRCLVRWNVLLMCTWWVLAIIEYYMIVEYVELLLRLCWISWIAIAWWLRTLVVEFQESSLFEP